MHRVLAEIDAHIDATGLSAEVLDPDPPPTIEIAHPAAVPLRLDLRERGITTVLWATGFRRAYPWLQVPVLDPAGEIRQWRGRTPVPGLYVLGQRFQHHRNSNFIDGVGRDAATVADDLVRKRCTTS
jgi:putative flavoprotein involved in K+ transport